MPILVASSIVFPDESRILIRQREESPAPALFAGVPVRGIRIVARLSGLSNMYPTQGSKDEDLVNEPLNVQMSGMVPAPFTLCTEDHGIVVGNGLVIRFQPG
jgi:hypothetical protein